MKLLEKIEKIPGGIVLVPMTITAVIHTFLPELLAVGGITTALFSDYAVMTFIGILLFLAGSQLQVRTVPAALMRGGVLLLVKLALAVALTLGYGALFGSNGIAGVSLLAFCITVCSLNPGTFLAVAAEHGDEVDIPGFAFYNLIVVPAVPALILGAAGGTAMDWMGILTTLIPFLLGMLLGNLDPDFRALFATTARPVLFFAGFTFGASVDLLAAARCGGAGFLLTGLYLLICATILYFTDRLVLKQPGYASVSLSCVSPASVSMPTIVAAVLPQFEPYASAATAQIAATVVLTTVVCTLLTRQVLRRMA